MTEKLKAAVREAWIDCGWANPDSTVDKLVNALARRGVVVQGDVRKIDSNPCLAKAREDEDAFIILARDPVGCLVLNFWCDQRSTLIHQGILPDNEQEWQRIQQVRDKAKVFFEYEPKSYGKGAVNSPQTPPAPVFEVGKTYQTRGGNLVKVHAVWESTMRVIGVKEKCGYWVYTNGAFRLTNEHNLDLIPGAIPDEPAPVFREEPPSVGGDWRDMRQDAPALTPLTYEQACALPVGSEVVCLDVPDYYQELISKGKIYKIKKKSVLQANAPVIESDYGDINFVIKEKDCHLFAAVPSSAVGVEKSSPVITDQLAEVNTNAAGESPAPAMTDEEIGKELNETWVKNIHPFPDLWPSVVRRARELLQPDSFTEGHLTFEGVSKLVARAEKAEAALEKVRYELESWLRPESTSEMAHHVDDILKTLARNCGFKIIPAEPAKPLRVEVGK